MSNGRLEHDHFKRTDSGRGHWVGKEAKNIAVATELVDAKVARLVAQREAVAVDQNSGFRLEFSEKLAEAVAKQRRISIKDFKAAAKFREKRHATD